MHRPRGARLTALLLCAAVAAGLLIPASSASASVPAGWRVYNPRLRGDPLAIDFVDRLYGFMIVANRNLDGGVYCSSNGGQTWRLLVRTRTSLFNDYPIAMDFVSRTRGWMVGSSGTIYRTRDGGRHWTKQRVGGVTYLTEVQAVDGNHVWVIGGRNFLRSTNGGSTWTRSTLPTGGGFRTMHFTDSARGWVVGNTTAVSWGEPGRTLIAQTVDGGRTWQLQDNPGTPYPEDVAFVGPTMGWVAVSVGGASNLLRTNDGATWRLVEPEAYSQSGARLAMPNIDRLLFVDSSRGYAGATGGGMPAIFVTTDGGNRWTMHWMSGLTSTQQTKLRTLCSVGSRYVWAGITVYDSRPADSTRAFTVRILASNGH